MKHSRKISAGLLLIAYFFSPALIAQDEAEKKEKKATILVVTTVHSNLNKTDGSQKELLELEKEYFEKVTNKNEYILHSNYLVHYFTADNTERKLISAYASWEDMKKANERTTKLINEGWTDSIARQTFFKKQGSYYSSYHSDQIYSILDEGKYLTEKPTESMLYYVRVSHLAFPEDAKKDELKELHSEFLENVIYKNEYVKAYYMNRHMWGDDSRDLVEVTVLNSLNDMEPYFDLNTELSKAHWDEEAGKAFGEKYSKYFSGFHADYLYSNIPELMK